MRDKWDKRSINLLLSQEKYENLGMDEIMQLKRRTFAFFGTWTGFPYSNNPNWEMILYSPPVG